MSKRHGRNLKDIRRQTEKAKMWKREKFPPEGVGLGGQGGMEWYKKRAKFSDKKRSTVVQILCYNFFIRKFL